VEDWENAVQNYQTAIKLDSAFALAYAELAKAHARMYYLRHDVSEIRLRQADHAAQKAIQLNAQSAQVRLALGYYYLWAYRDREKALEEWAKVEEQLPNNVDILRTKSYVYEPQGRWQEGIEALERAFELDPKNASLPTHLALFYWMIRHYEKALDYCNQAIVLEPGAVWPYLYKTFIHWSWKGADDVSREILSAAPMDQDYEWYLWSWYFQEVGERHLENSLELIDKSPGKWLKHKMWAMPKDMLAGFVHQYRDEREKAYNCFERSVPLLQQACQAYPDDPRYHSSLGVALAGTGNKAEAIAQGKRAVELLPLSKDAAYGLPYAIDLVIIYAMVGETDVALEQLEILLKIPSFVTPEWLKIDIRNAPLYGNEKWERLMEKYGKYNL
jgi:serine/threonine-protein kinase